jgi:argininosuccinate lyase
MHEFNRSIHYTKKLYKVDIRQSLAYSKALHKAGILTEAESVEMMRGLKAVEKEWDDGTVSIDGKSCLWPCLTETVSRLGSS